MPRTLLLALIATAMTACNKSGGVRQELVTPDNIRKLPVKGGRRSEIDPERATNEDSSVAH